MIGPLRDGAAWPVGLEAQGLDAAQAPGEPSAVIAPDCDRACLIGHVEAHMKALAARDPGAEARPQAGGTGPVSGRPAP